MSRMLEALKQIESKRSRPESPAIDPCLADRRAESVPDRIPDEWEEEPANIAPKRYDTALAGLHPVIQKELDTLQSAPLLDIEPIAIAPSAKTLTADPFDIETSLARAELAVSSALLPEKPDIYVEMAQYILTQTTPGRPAVLLFTSPGDNTGQTETLFLLSKTLVNHFHWKVFVLDAFQNADSCQIRITPRIAGDWGNLLEQLKTRYQLVLINAPSLTNAQTATAISQCDGVYLVIRLGYSTSYEVGESVRVIQQAGGRLLGSIAIGEKL
jgi:hypothetical protein